MTFRERGYKEMKKLSDEDSGDILGGTEEARISQSLSLVIGDLHSPPSHPVSFSRTRPPLLVSTGDSGLSCPSLYLLLPPAVNNDHYLCVLKMC